ncbi:MULTISPECIES: YggS family pyridoxal phosphate-dependent enzyme [Deinococcus]|uniref:YggS family pyridoxal phosphate-dependent enzyme n=1 Tax=Deinococcus TaxID=1298 RepID=UPI0018DF9922|nr:YggS family pyridoxal phosphate-dependent enzyme [Deinococcus sp. DB0503]
MSLPEVLAGIRAAAERAGRPAESVRLVAVTKGHDLEAIRTQVLRYADLQPGGFPLGENRAQELRDKAAAWSALGWPSAEWHFIGPLQLNKVKYLRPVRLVHSLEDVRQAQAIADAAAKWGQAPDVLLQLHNGEAQKHGIHPADLRRVYAGVMQTGLKVRGLMVMAPEGDEAAARRVFAETAQRAHDLGLPELSMGMSGDYPLAIEQGATLVRVGRSLFT